MYTSSLFLISLILLKQAVLLSYITAFHGYKQWRTFTPMPACIINERTSLVVILTPRTAAEGHTVADDFHPNGVGALDGKHIYIQALICKSCENIWDFQGLEFHHLHGWCWFLYATLGTQGRASSVGLSACSNLTKAPQRGLLNLLFPKHLVQSDTVTDVWF